jgi:hypothetical protein
MPLIHLQNDRRRRRPQQSALDVGPAYTMSIFRVQFWLIVTARMTITARPWPQRQESTSMMTSCISLFGRTQTLLANNFRRWLTWHYSSISARLQICGHPRDLFSKRCSPQKVYAPVELSNALPHLFRNLFLSHSPQAVFRWDGGPRPRGIPSSSFPTWADSLSRSKAQGS